MITQVGGATVDITGGETYQAGIVLAADVGADGTSAGSSFSAVQTTLNGLADAGLNTLAYDRNILNDVDVLTGTTANDALQSIDFALDQVNSLRAELGATQIRFEATISNLQVSSENLSAARSRIRDADFAAETAELTRVQILQQAGIAILSQANAQPQNVLALLQ